MHFCNHKTDTHGKGVLAEMLKHAGFSPGNGTSLFFNPATALFLGIADKYLTATFLINQPVTYHV